MFHQNITVIVTELFTSGVTSHHVTIARDITADCVTVTGDIETPPVGPCGLWVMLAERLSVLKLILDSKYKFTQYNPCIHLNLR